MFSSTVSTKTNAPRDRCPSGRGAQVWFNLLPHPGLVLLVTDLSLEAAATPIPEGPGANLRTGGGFGLPPMDRFTSPALLNPYNRPHRASGRQLDALPCDGARRSMRAFCGGLRRVWIVTLGGGVRALKWLGARVAYPHTGTRIEAP